MGDPLFLHGVDVGALVIAIVKVVAIFGVLLVSVMLMIWLERKVISDMQNRIGPNRAGPFGLLQSLADGIKLFFKEDLLPERADRFVFKLAPYLTLVPAFLIFTVVPVGGVVNIAHHVVELQVADPPIGILFLLALSSVSVYGTMLAGWSSGSKYPLLGSVRASAQMISYEAAMGLSVVAVVLQDHTLSTRGIVLSQAPHVWDWGVFRTGIIPFLIFWVAVTAELNRPPFDLVEGEQELVGGFNTEYSSIRFAMFYLAEFMNMITMSAIMVTLFFGGPDGPGFHFARWLWPILWFAAKTGVFLYVYVWIRAALPRLRYDQLMDVGWKALIPLSLGWLLVIAGADINAAWLFAIFGGGLVAAGLLYRTLVVSRRRRELEAQSPGTGRARRLAARPLLSEVGPADAPALATPAEGSR
jgi:NADH-quinone oxidoreductase subunit H